uniref:Uncharacterized protein n=1 Tax=Anguilla anguilla TaxID=7936 RepID=A0A0E9RMV6_ANGAN
MALGTIHKRETDCSVFICAGPRAGPGCNILSGFNDDVGFFLISDRALRLNQARQGHGALKQTHMTC